jgi:hypothetical protein
MRRRCVSPSRNPWLAWSADPSSLPVRMILLLGVLGLFLGAAPAALAEDLCVENPLEGVGRPPRDESGCESLGATLVAVGFAFFEDCSTSNPAITRKYAEITARYAGLPPQVGLPAMLAEFVSEGRKDAARCAMRAVVREGMNLTPEARAELISVMDGVFELQDIWELMKDIGEGRSNPMKKEELKNKFWKELVDRYEGSEQLEPGFSALMEALTSHQSQSRSALDASEQQLNNCAVASDTAASLFRSVQSGRRALFDTRLAIRRAEREAECWAGHLRRQYGADWNLHPVAVAGPSLDAYRHAVNARASLERSEAAIVETLQQAGTNCGRLKQQFALHQRILEQYAAAKARAEDALRAGPCDLSAAEDALRTLRNLEGGLCGKRLVMYVSNEIEARIASRRSERRMTDACNEGPPGGSVDAFSGEWQCPQRGIITLSANVDSLGGSVTGSVSGRPGEHWGAGQRAGGRITGTVVGRTLQLVMESGDGTVSRLTGTLAIDERSFSGPWEWFRGDKRLASGTWQCQRAAGYVPPARTRDASQRLDTPQNETAASPGSAASAAGAPPVDSRRLLYGGLVIEVQYERGTDERGVPIDLYYYRNRAIPGAPVPQGEQEWNRFVRVPAEGTSSSEPVVWWHSRWTYGTDGWVSVAEKGIEPPQAVK